MTGRRVQPDDPAELKLGKGGSFVKTRLMRQRQEDDTWQVDFFAIPCPDGEHVVGYLGIACDQRGYVLRDIEIDTKPTVNDLARLLADAMLRPWEGQGHRPSTLLLRDRPEWCQPLPHLRQLRIELKFAQKLPICDRLFNESLKQAKREYKLNKNRGKT